VRPVRLVVGFPAGGPSDVPARLIAEKIRVPLGQPVIVETVAGAGGTIGVSRLARSAPDGYTIDIGQWDNHVGAIIFSITYDLQKDFTPIGLMTINPQVVIARKGFPADDLKGLVAWMKANPGKGTLVEQTAAAKIAGIQMMQMTGTKIEFIPFKGAGPAMQAMLGGQVDLMILQAAAALPQARAGAVKILANLSPQRSRVIPDLPTSDEAGIPGLYAAGWFGLFGPRGLPKEIVAKLNGAMVQALADPKVQARLSELGLDLASREQQTPEGFAAFHKAETDKWLPVIKASGIKVE
jgi:tripartite-type tricarboxylate transporter receptor subunit TctC